jgi:hypothetical protein
LTCRLLIKQWCRPLSDGLTGAIGTLRRRFGQSVGLVECYFRVDYSIGQGSQSGASVPVGVAAGYGVVTGARVSLLPYCDEAAAAVVISIVTQPRDYGPSHHNCWLLAVSCQAVTVEWLIGAIAASRAGRRLSPGLP